MVVELGATWPTVAPMAQLEAVKAKEVCTKPLQVVPQMEVEKTVGAATGLMLILTVD